VGTLASAYTLTNSTQSYVITTTDDSSYTSIASSSGLYDVGNVSGYAPFMWKRIIRARFFSIG